MKNAVVTLSVFLAFASAASAQLYLNVGLGYAAAQAGQTYDWNGMPFNGTRTSFSSGNYNYSVKNASFSAGLQGSLGIGFMASNNIGFQLDAVIGISNKKYTFRDDSIALPTGSGTIPGTESVVQQASTPIIFMPSIIVQTGGDPLNVYCRFGLALPVNTKITEDQIYSTYPGMGAVETQDYSYQLKSSFGLGFAGAAGVKYQLNDRVSMWGELSILSLSVFIKESDFQNVTDVVGGTSYPVTYSGPKVIKYSKNATIDSTYSNFPAYSQPFSNVAFNVGVTFRLTDKKEPHSKRVKSNNARLREERNF